MEQKIINFMGQRKLAMIISSMLIIISITGLLTKGLSFGIDFTGGTIIELEYDKPANLKQIRTNLQSNGFPFSTVQNFGTAKNILIRVAPQKDINSAQLSNRILDNLNAAYDGNIDVRRVEFVGPQVGKELTEDGSLAVIYALIGILIYVALRFEFRFAVGSVAALLHDVILTLGVFSWLQLQFDLTVLAAILAVIGYSLNDTIVVFDRVRENFRTILKGTPIEVTNIAINQMLSRTIMTSLTTLLVLFSLFFLGGEIIHNFALTLIIGIIVGTYSSTYIASSIALSLGVSKEDLMKTVKEDKDRSKVEEEVQRAFLEQEKLR